MSDGARVDYFFGGLDTHEPSHSEGAACATYQGLGMPLVLGDPGTYVCMHCGGYERDHDIKAF